MDEKEDEKKAEMAEMWRRMQGGKREGEGGGGGRDLTNGVGTDVEGLGASVDAPLGVTDLHRHDVPVAWQKAVHAPTHPRARRVGHVTLRAVLLDATAREDKRSESDITQLVCSAVSLHASSVLQGICNDLLQREHKTEASDIFLGPYSFSF